jgi:hypothetical protein
MLFEKRLQVRAADFLLAFKQQRQIHRQIGMLRQRFGQSLHVRHELAFVVRRTTAEDAAITDRRLERGRFPLSQRLRRLHIVMRIQQHRATTGDVLVFRQQHRMAGRLMQLTRQTHLTHFAQQPLGARTHIGIACRVSGNRRKAQAGEKMVESGWVHPPD